MKKGIGMSIRTIMMIALGLMVILTVFAAVSGVVSGDGSLVGQFVSGLEMPSGP
jgi:ABC-type antimicrobial peptide transport system permease subunit